MTHESPDLKIFGDKFVPSEKIQNKVRPRKPAPPLILTFVYLQNVNLPKLYLHVIG